MARSALCSAVMAMSAVCGLAADVLTLTGETFSDAVKKHEKLVVEFYAPWCGHCKKLEPEYEKAAGKLKDEGITLAKVDATDEQNKEISSKFGVSGFPTLKVFRGSEESPSEWEGPRDAEGIVSYAKRQFGPAVTKISTEEEAKKATTPSADLSVVGVFPDGDDSKAAKAFKEVAESLRNDATFVYTTNEKLVKDSGGKQAVLVYRDFDDNMVKFDGKFEKGPMAEFVEKASSPRLPALDGKARNKKAMAKAFGDKKPKVIGIVAADHKDLKAYQDALIEAREAADDKVHVIYLSPEDNPGAVKYFGASPEDTPIVVVHDPAKDAKYVSGKKIEAKKVKQWIEDFKAGKIERHIKSEDPPKKNDGPVKIVTAKTFKDIVYSGKNVLVEFYAPWCGHCKKLEPVYNELGEAYKAEKDIVIAKMDATANDVPDDKIQVQGFPTIKFVTKKGEVKEYEGGRSLEDFKKFLEKETGIKLKEAKKEEKKGDKKEAKGGKEDVKKAEKDGDKKDEL